MSSSDYPTSNAPLNTGAVERAVIGATIGAIIGTLFLPGVGTAGGAKIGAMIGTGSSDLS